jgi:hypothetical protein
MFKNWREKQHVDLNILCAHKVVLRKIDNFVSCVEDTKYGVIFFTMTLFVFLHKTQKMWFFAKLDVRT